MIKLVSQFDNEKSKMSLATPTCGCCCCCCCCCLVSTVATASITSRSFGKLFDKNSYIGTEDPKKSRAIAFGCTAPFACVLSISLFVLYFSTQSVISILVSLACVIYLAAMFISFKKHKKVFSKMIALTVASSFILAVVVVAEAFIGGILVLMGGIIIYLLAAIAIDVAILIALSRASSSDEENAENARAIFLGPTPEQPESESCVKRILRQDENSENNSNDNGGIKW